jgi:hypothetical protein
MTIIKRIKFKSASGKVHSYIATYIDGVIVSDDWNEIQRLKAH